jgi:hypothetical protein
VAASRGRAIGPIGTVARVVVGLAALVGGMLGGQLTVIDGQLRSHFETVPFLVGALVFPAVVLALQWLRALWMPKRFEATGPVATALNILVFVALVFTPSYAPALSVTSDAALVFYGGSMLVAALRGYGGCEVLAISNWILRRDDQIGCLVFGPLDAAEHRQARSAG